VVEIRRRLVVQRTVETHRTPDYQAAFLTPGAFSVDFRRMMRRRMGASGSIENTGSRAVRRGIAAIGFTATSTGSVRTPDPNHHGVGLDAASGFSLHHCSSVTVIDGCLPLTGCLPLIGCLSLMASHHAAVGTRPPVRLDWQISTGQRGGCGPQRTARAEG
jgi:hypothetical protein